MLITIHGRGKIKSWLFQAILLPPCASGYLHAARSGQSTVAHRGYAANKKVAANKIMLLQIKNNSCCKLSDRKVSGHTVRKRRTWYSCIQGSNTSQGRCHVLLFLWLRIFVFRKLLHSSWPSDQWRYWTQLEGFSGCWRTNQRVLFPPRTSLCCHRWFVGKTKWGLNARLNSEKEA